MIYKVLFRKRNGRTLGYFLQVFWVDINLNTNDEQLKGKIIAALDANDYEMLYYSDEDN